MQFTVQVCTLRFRAIDAIGFPPPSAGNTLRGALGDWLRHASNPERYRYWFAPKAANGPSGLADAARPFVLRAQALDDRQVAPGEEFAFDVHIFPGGAAGPQVLADTFHMAATHGLGAGRGRARLIEVTGREQSVNVLQPVPAARARVDFLTPTELKHQGVIVRTPEFAVLFARVRDRVARLIELYGRGVPSGFDFSATGERAHSVTMARCELAWRERERRSSRTGQTHPLGGFTGLAEYQGHLDEFIPWLHAAELSGVGRQTVWGSGCIRATVAAE